MMLDFIKIVVGTFIGFMLTACAMFGLASSKKFMTWYSKKYMKVINEVTDELVDKF